VFTFPDAQPPDWTGFGAASELASCEVSKPVTVWSNDDDSRLDSIYTFLINLPYANKTNTHHPSRKIKMRDRPGLEFVDAVVGGVRVEQRRVGVVRSHRD
jgi:hypothetical protein